jgi:hypothetical protein
MSAIHSYRRPSVPEAGTAALVWRDAILGWLSASRLERADPGPARAPEDATEQRDEEPGEGQVPAREAVGRPGPENPPLEGPSAGGFSEGDDRSSGDITHEPQWPAGESGPVER